MCDVANQVNKVDIGNRKNAPKLSTSSLTGLWMFDRSTCTGLAKYMMMVRKEFHHLVKCSSRCLLEEKHQVEVEHSKGARNQDPCFDPLSFLSIML